MYICTSTCTICPAHPTLHVHVYALHIICVGVKTRCFIYNITGFSQKPKNLELKQTDTPSLPSHTATQEPPAPPTKPTHSSLSSIPGSSLSPIPGSSLSSIPGSSLNRLYVVRPSTDNKRDSPAQKGIVIVPEIKNGIENFDRQSRMTMTEVDSSKHSSTTKEEPPYMVYPVGDLEASNSDMDPASVGVPPPSSLPAQLPPKDTHLSKGSEEQETSTITTDQSIPLQQYHSLPSKGHLKTAIASTSDNAITTATGNSVTTLSDRKPLMNKSDHTSVTHDSQDTHLTPPTLNNMASLDSKSSMDDSRPNMLDSKDASMVNSDRTGSFGLPDSLKSDIADHDSVKSGSVKSLESGSSASKARTIISKSTTTTSSCDEDRALPYLPIIPDLSMEECCSEDVVKAMLHNEGEMFFTLLDSLEGSEDLNKPVPSEYSKVSMNTIGTHMYKYMYNMYTYTCSCVGL